MESESGRNAKDPRRRFYGLRRANGKCHRCELDYRRVAFAERWEDKYSERAVAKDYRTCISCGESLTWWWFCLMPTTREEIITFLAWCDQKERDLSQQSETVQLEDGHG